MAKIALSDVSRKDRNNWRGYFAYNMNKEAGGANSRAILAVWYAWITSESGKTIYGNNPLNVTCGKGDGCYAGQIGWFQFPGNTRKFAAFDSPQSAARAYIALLANNPQYRYPPILAAARRDDWQGMIEAIIKSCWVSCTRPGYGGLNGSFWSVWNGVRTAVDQDIDSGAIGRAPLDTMEDRNIQRAIDEARQKGTDNLLGGWADQVKFPVDHPLTTGDVQYIMTTLTANCWFSVNHDCANGINEQAAETTRVILLRHVGEKWNKSLQEALQQELSKAAEDAAIDPLSAVAQGITGAVELFGRLLDPQTYVRGGAFILGLIIAFIGFKMLMDASAGARAEA